MELPWKLFAGILVLWLIVGLVPTALWRDLHEASDFANTFGFVNALFAALAFGGVIWAIRLQTRELELQRLEIEETRDELRRAADAQQQTQKMHFLAALLTARNNVAHGYATCAENESGPLQLNRLAHRKHLAQLEWLLQLVDREEGNPFVLPPDETIVANQMAILLTRTHPLLTSALSKHATNYVRTILLDMTSSLRDLRRLLLLDDIVQSDLEQTVDRVLTLAETVNTAGCGDEVAEICRETFNQLSSKLSPIVGRTLPLLSADEGPGGAVSVAADATGGESTVDPPVAER